MHRTKFEETRTQAFSEVIALKRTAEIAKAEIDDLGPASTVSSSDVLDKLLSLIKVVFLFLPGVACLHLAMMGLALVLFLGDFGALDLLELLGFIALGTFLTMVGLGKIQDLKYLQTVLTILGISFLLGVLSDILAVFLNGDFWSLYTKLTLPVVVLIGYLSKRSIDRKDGV